MYSIYVRLVLEANQYIMLTSFSEIVEWSPSSPVRIVSLCIAFAIALVKIIMLASCVIIWRKYKAGYDPAEYARFKELFTNLKDRHISRLYPVALIFRRCFFVSLLVFGQSFGQITLIASML